MLDIQFIIENKEIVKKSIKDRNMKDVDLDNLEMLYKKRLELIKNIDEINRQRKIAANDRNAEEGRRLKEESSTKEDELTKTNQELTALLSVIPNITSPDMPIGKDESENKILKKVGEIKNFSFITMGQTVRVCRLENEHLFFIISIDSKRACLKVQCISEFSFWSCSWHCTLFIISPCP